MLTSFNKKPFFTKKWTTDFWVENMRKIQEIYKPYTIEIKKSSEFFDSKYILVSKLPKDNNTPPFKLTGVLLFLSISSMLYYFYNSNKCIKHNY
jgi:hypothetical protein